MRAPSSLLLLAAAAAARAPGVAPLRDVDPALDCGLRAIAYNFSLARLPDGGSAALVHDALRLAVDCGQAFAPVLGAAAPPRPRLPPRAADAPTFYVSPGGDDAAAGTEAAPFATLARALRASRAGAVAARLVLRAGTHALAAPLVLTAADSGLSIAAYPGEAPVVSGGEALPADLEWTRFAPLPAGGVSGPFPELSIVSDAPGLTPGGNTTGIVYAGDFSTGEACRAACAAAAACTGYTWHDATVPDGWAQQGFFRTDNQYNPTQQTQGHFCGQKTQGQNATIWRAQLPAGTAAFDNLFDAARGRRLTRARSPNGNPEERIDGFTGGATAWLPPLPYAAPEEVHIASPSRDDDPFFPAYQLGVGGTCAVFEPASGFWCSKSPPAGSQFNVPGGMQIPAGLLGGGWADPTGAILHAFHGLRWGDWKFLVDGGNATHLSWTYGGHQEARGWAYGSTFMLENLLALLDEHDEFFFDAAAGALYVAVNDTAGGAFANPPLIATRLDSLIRVAGTPDEPVSGIVLDGLTFSHTAPTFMKPFAMASGGDLSVRVDGAVFLEGSVGAVVENCTFSGVGGNALFLYGFNRNASVTNSRFRFVGDSAVMSLGKVQGIDGTAREVPWGTVVAGNIMSEIGIYTKQSGAYYHALSGQASVVDNVMFNMPRAAININDGYAGGHRIEGNLAFNCVRETSDHGCCEARAASLSVGHFPPPLSSPTLPLPLIQSIRGTASRIFGTRRT